MSAMWLWISLVFFSFLNLHNAAAQSQMCEEPFKATITLVTNVTFPITASYFDLDLVHFRKINTLHSSPLFRNQSKLKQ